MQMDNRLYKLMDWPSIEEIVYSESSHPKRILGGHRVKEGFLIQVFRPDAPTLHILLLMPIAASDLSLLQLKP